MKCIPQLLLAAFTGFLTQTPAYAQESEWPVTCAAAVEFLLREVSDENRIDIRAMARDDLILLHHGFGTGIRNAMGLWGGNTALQLDCYKTANPQVPFPEAMHPDGTSMIIIEQFWLHLNHLK